MPPRQEKKLKELWQRDKYKILGAIKKAEKRSGLSLLEFSDLVDLPPSEARNFLNAITEWGANIYIKDNHIHSNKAIAVTKFTYPDLLPLTDIDVFGEKKSGFRFGVVADTHFGSTTTDISFLKTAYRYFQDQGISHVIHAGNVLAGKPQSDYRLVDFAEESLDGQIRLLEKQYPHYKDITTHFILGRSDITFGSEQINPALEICQVRPDFNYLGVVEVDLVFNPEGKKPFTIRIYCEKPVYTYGISYQPQKKLENTSGGDKPNIWMASGSQQVWYSRYLDVEAYKLPGMQHQTLKMRDRGYRCAVGFKTFNIIPEKNHVYVFDEDIPEWKRQTLKTTKKG